MTKFYSFIISAIFLSLNLQAQSIKNGNWKGIIHYETVEVPFTFNLTQTSETSVTVIIKNGEEEINIENAIIKNDSIHIPMYVFDAVIKAGYKNGKMIGEWHKNYKNKKGPLFTAEYDQPRFAIYPQKLKVIQPNWDITFVQPNGQSSKAVGLFKGVGNNSITGTIMTEVGDFRYFEGIIYADSIRLSSFDGVHGFLMLGIYQKKSWSGTFHYEDGYSEKWTAAYNPEAELTNPFSVTTVAPETHKPYYDILTAGGAYDAIDTDLLEGKVVVIQLMGTWCPNSLDQTKYLTEWIKTQNSNDIVVLAAAYEPGDKEYAQNRIDSYSKQLEIPYPIYIGGSLSKGQAALAFPNMGKINAFPTLVMIDKQGYIRFIDSYFNGPATGKFYEEFDKVFNEKIEILLSE